MLFKVIKTPLKTQNLAIIHIIEHLKLLNGKIDVLARVEKSNDGMNLMEM